MKKILLMIMTVLMVISAAGCAANVNVPETQLAAKHDLSGHIDMLGYMISYPADTSLSNARYGKTFCADDDVIVYIGAPIYGSDGKSETIADFSKVVSMCENAVCEAVWTATHIVANFTDPTQVVENTEEVVINDIQMLKVTGYFTTMKDVEPGIEKPKAEYVAYYMLRGIDNNTSYEPVYMIGIKWNTESAEPLMDEMANAVHDTFA